MPPNADAPAHAHRLRDVITAAVTTRLGGTVHRLAPLTRKPRVTVVIPCYNYGHYLENCVSSALDGQAGVDVEIIIVEDRSTDDSLAIARNIAAARPEVKVIAHERNKGAIATYNDGLSEATGDYVVLLSADDLLTPGSLTRAAQIMDMDPTIGLVYGASRAFSTELPQPRPGNGDWIHWPGDRWLRIRCRSGYNVVASPEVMMRTSVLRRIGYYRSDLPHTGDLEMWLRAATVSDVGFLVGADQAFYRQHATNMHKSTFKSGTYQGSLIDLEQRWMAFESALAQSATAQSELLPTVRATIARHAVEYSNYAVARGFKDFPFADYETLARRALPDLAQTRPGRALAWRKRLGMVSVLPLHPVWAPSAITLRVIEYWRRVRRMRVGV